MRLYIDDIRTPKNDRWKVVRSYTDALIYMSKVGCPNYISFDHDLGEGKTGYDITKWMVENDIEYPGWIPEEFHFNVHSANPVGKKNIESLLTNYLRHREVA
jgi:hypothetical protein